MIRQHSDWENLILDSFNLSVIFYNLLWIQIGNKGLRVLYRVKKVFNTNVALVNDEKGLEKIFVGRGLSFGKKKGDIILPDKAEKIFTVDSPELTERFIQLTKEVPINHLELVAKITKEAEKELKCNFDEALYIGLADHISYAINRYRKGEIITNALLFEIQKFYPKEYAAALNALKIIAYDEQIQFSKDEAGFIALHFVNGEQNNSKNKSDVMMTVDILNKVSLIVEDYLGIELEENSLNYIRFITHLKFFIQRVSSNQLGDDTLPDIFQQVIDSYPEAANCVEVISEYLKEKLQCTVYPEEKVYLILHVQRLMK